MRLFDTVVTPTVLYGLVSAPLSATLMQKLDISQRCMLRRLVGWVCYDTDTWEDKGRRMKLRMEKAMQLYPLEAWSAKLQGQKESFIEQMQDMPHWTRLAYEWDPVACNRVNNMKAYRKRGRPRIRCI